MDTGIELSILNSLKSLIGRWFALARIKIAQNKIKFFTYLTLILFACLLVSHLLGDSFSVGQIQHHGEAKRNLRETNQLSSSGVGGQSLDPFGTRPRIQTQNGHLIIQASQDKNIDFKTSGSRGSITLNGLKLDQLLGVARALSQRQLTGGANSTLLINDGTGTNVQDQYELLVKSLLDSSSKLQQLDKTTESLIRQLGELNKLVNKLAKRGSRRAEQASKLAKRLDKLELRLKENNCFDFETGQPVCKNGAACVDQFDSFKCLCTDQFEGPTCELDVDECQRFKGTDLGCQNGGKCVNLAGGYRCECPLQFRGVHCTETHDDCSLASSSSMCGHGKCINVARNQANQPAFECICDQGWTQDPQSRACIIDINECQANLNVSGGLLLTTSMTSSEVMMMNQLQPTQLQAYPCSQNPLVECINLPGSFQCGPCPPGYTGNGRLCRDIDECQQNNGGCSTSPLVECWNLPGTRRCAPCPPGYQGNGIDCQRQSACQMGENGGCHPMAKCHDLAGVANQDAARVCVCQYPFVGKGLGPTGCVALGATNPDGTVQAAEFILPPSAGGLQVLTDAATAAAAASGGNLSNQISGALGELLAQMPNLTAYTIVQQQDDCQPNPCLNGAQCIQSDGNFECLCAADWSGRLCDEMVDFACGGRFHTSRGFLNFPLGNSFERLVKLATSKQAVGKQTTGSGGGSGTRTDSSGKQMAKYQCTWSLTVPGNMSLKLTFANLTARQPGDGIRLQASDSKQVQVNIFDSSTQHHATFNPPNCHEFLDVTERLDHALEVAGARGRLLARLCIIPGRAPDLREKAIGSQQLQQQQQQQMLGATLMADSNMLDLDYSFTPARLLDEPALSFQLNWTKTEPACGGQLPIQESGSISSPRFPDFYPAGSECRYVLRVPAGKRIRIQLGELTLLSGRPQSDSCADSLVILDGSLGGPDRPVLFRHCANQLAGRLESFANSPTSTLKPIVSSSSSVEVVLISRLESTTPLLRPKQKRGFYLTYASEPSIPGCGGLYTAKSATIKSIDYEKALNSNLNDEALAFEYARYFDQQQQQQDDSPNYYASANLGWDQLVASSSFPKLYGGSGGVASGLASYRSGSGENNSTSSTAQTGDKRIPSSSGGTTGKGGGGGGETLTQLSSRYRTRCEYEIRPAEQARNHRIEIDWLEMPSETSADSMGSLTRWSRRSRCMESRLMIFSANPAGESHQSSASSSSSTSGGSSSYFHSDLLLRTFCAGDRFNSSLTHSMPIASSGHVLYLIYESINSLNPSDEFPFSNSASNINDLLTSTWTPKKSSTGGGGGGGNKQQLRPLASGFKLHYSTVCSAIYRQLEGQIITELDPEVDECLYHIMLPPNNTISLLIEPLLPPGAAFGAGTGTGAGSSGATSATTGPLNLPDGSCAAQAVFIDGVVGRGKLALAQMERQLRTYDFSGATFGGAAAAGSSRPGETSDSGQVDSTANVFGARFSTLAPGDNSGPLESSDSSGKSFQEARATGNSQPTSSDGFTRSSQSMAAAAAGARNSYWQYGTSQAHDIKEFDVCKLPELGIDSVWNHMSLMFKLNPKLRSMAAASGQNGFLKPFEKLKVVIKYQAESSCGGVISEPRQGSIRLISARPVNSLSNYPLTISRYEQLHRQLFVNQCAWILRNAPNQLIQLTFDQVPVKEIAQRRSEWIAWLRARAARKTIGSSTNKQQNSSTQKASKLSAGDGKAAAAAVAWNQESTSSTGNSNEDSTPPIITNSESKRQLMNLANCSQAFLELIEVYEPTANRTRFICPSELIDSAAAAASSSSSQKLQLSNFHWTTQSDTVFVRLINNTMPTTTTTTTQNSTNGGSKQNSDDQFPGLKPLKGFPPMLQYKMLSGRDSRCGGRLIQASGLIQSPRFPFNYGTNLNCIWILEAPSAEQQLRLNFSRFHLEESAHCWFDYLEIRNGPHEQSPLLGRFCGRDLQSRLLISQSHSLWIRFRTDSHLNRAGFQFTFDAAQTGCGGHLTAPTGQIDSPNYPYAFAQSAACEWTIEVAAGNRISLEFDDLDLSGLSESLVLNQRLLEETKQPEDSTGQKTKCKTEGLGADYLEIFDSNYNAPARSLGRFCHLSQLISSAGKNATTTTTQGRLSSSSNKLHLVYRSQAQDSGRGFRLRYRTNCTYEMELSGFGGVIESPSSSVQAGEFCSWVLRAPLGSNLSIAITELNLIDEKEMAERDFDSAENPFGAALSSRSAMRSIQSGSLDGKLQSTKQQQQQTSATLCSPLHDRLNIWAATLQVNEAKNASIEQQLQPLDKFKVKAFAKRQELEMVSQKVAQNGSLGLYNLTLAQSFCGHLDELPTTTSGNNNNNNKLALKNRNQFEVASNLAIINLLAVDAVRGLELRNFRLEWRARGCGNFLQGDAALLAEGLKFDERLNLTQRQLGKPLECLWLIDMSHSSSSSSNSQRLFELLISTNMLVPPSSSSDIKLPLKNPCDDGSLTLYDGPDTRAPVLMQNCNERRTHESLYVTSGQLLVRFFSSGRLASFGVAGRNFQLRGWPVGRYEGPDGTSCSHSIFDISTPFFQVAGTQTSPNYPDLYEAKAYKCTNLLTSANSGRLRLKIEELDIPLGTTQDGDIELNSNDNNLASAEVCKKSGNYLKLRGSLEPPHLDYLCGKLDRSTGLGLDSPEALARSTFVVESATAWLEFVSRGSSRGRWKLTYDRLCGSTINHLHQAEEFQTPNYPEQPQWPETTTTTTTQLSSTASRAENVCIWRLSTQAPTPLESDYLYEDQQGVGVASSSISSSSSSSSKVHFNLLDFIESNRLSNSPSDCLRVYEGASISLKTSTFNLTELDTKLRPKIKICSQADLKFNSLSYVSLGSEITILVSGNAGAHFRVRPFENHCGAYLMLRQGEFASPNYPQPYGPDLDCHYFVFGAPGARIALNFANFDVGEKQTATAGSSLSQIENTADNKCESSDYIEVRQLPVSARFKFARKQLLKWQLADRENLNSFLKHFGNVPGKNFTQSTGSLTEQTKQQLAGGKLQAKAFARHKSLERLFELANVFYVFDESLDSSFLQTSGRVRGQNQRLAIRLEEFYAASKLIGRFCGQVAPKLALNQLQDEILIRLRSHSSQSQLQSDGLSDLASNSLGANNNNNRNSRGFLASYKLEYGAQIRVEPQQQQQQNGNNNDQQQQQQHDDNDDDDLSPLNLISSPSFPASRSLNASLKWTFETRSNHVLEFELISLNLGSIHESCQDSLSIHDGLRPYAGSLRLAQLCGELSYRRLLDKSMAQLWSKALDGSISARKLPIHLAHEPQVRANLIRRIRTSSNVATLIYDNFRGPGRFLLRYRALSKSQVVLNSDDLFDKPLEADETLDDQWAIVAPIDGAANATDLSAGPGASRSCSRVYKLHLKALSSLSVDIKQQQQQQQVTNSSTKSPTPSSTTVDKVEITSPNWPQQVEQREIECHWLVRAMDNTNIRLAIEPSDSMMLAAAQASASVGADQFGFNEAGSLRYTHDHCFKSRQRNFVQIFDGASSLAPLLGRYCLPVPPIQLQSTGRHLFIRYVHADDLGADSKSLNELSSNVMSSNEEEQIEQQQAALRTSLFKASASVGHCGGQYHVMFQTRIRDRPQTTGESGNTNKLQVSNYENNLDCLYYVFAASQDHVLTLYEPTYSELDLASEPTNSACSIGDYIEVRDLPLSGDHLDGGGAIMTGVSGRGEGRLLGRFCAGHPLTQPLESPGAALVIRFHTDQANTGRGFDLFLMSSPVRLGCPRSPIQLTPDEPYAMLMSPNWPHGFTGKRRCKYSLMAPRNQTLEVKFVRLLRPMTIISATQRTIKCLDSFAYLDDNQAHGAQHDDAPLKQLRTFDEGTLLRQLVQEVPCMRPSAYKNLGMRESKILFDDQQQQQQDNSSGNSSYTRSFISKISTAEYKRLLDKTPASNLVIRTQSRSLLLDYQARNLLQNEGFLAIVRLAELPRERVCGGEIYARPGRNKLESARFGQLMNDSDPLVQCEWSLKSDVQAQSDYDFIYATNFFTLDTAPAAAAADSSGLATPGEFRTSFLAFQTLELAPLVQNTTMFEEQWGGQSSAPANEQCGLNRLMLTDSSETNQLVACGYLTNLPIARWHLTNLALDTVRLRTRNLERVVYARWPTSTTTTTTGTTGELEGKTKLFRGLRAYFYETRCPAAERLPGDTLRVRSHSAYNYANSNSNSSSTKLIAQGYQPGICQWYLRLSPGHYELSMRHINLRWAPTLQVQTRSQQANNNNNNKTIACDLASEQDYLEIRESLYQDAPVLARFCAQNQLEAGKHKLELNTRSELSVLFVAGLSRLRDGQDKFADYVDPSRGPQQLLQPNVAALKPQVSSSAAAAAASGKQFGFELQVTRVKNVTVSDFCKRDSAFNIYQLVRNHERFQTYGLDYYSGAIKPNVLYSKNAHCEIDLALDSDYRFNLTFTGFFDLEPSRDCKADYLELSDLLDDNEQEGEVGSQSKTNGKSTNKPTRPGGGGGKSPGKSAKSTTTTTTTSRPQSTSTRKPGASSSVSMYRKFRLSSKPIGRWCGRTLPKGSFLSKSNKIRLVFHSNEQIEGKGFLLDWSAVPAPAADSS